MGTKLLHFGRSVNFPLNIFLRPQRNMPQLRAPQLQHSPLAFMIRPEHWLQPERVRVQECFRHFRQKRASAIVQPEIRRSLTQATFFLPRREHRSMLTMTTLIRMPPEMRRTWSVPCKIENFHGRPQRFRSVRSKLLADLCITSLLFVGMRIKMLLLLRTRGQAEQMILMKTIQYRLRLHPAPEVSCACALG